MPSTEATIFNAILRRTFPVVRDSTPRSIRYVEHARRMLRIQALLAISQARYLKGDLSAAAYNRRFEALRHLASATQITPTMWHRDEEILAQFALKERTQ